jgi:hypothetical protein
MRTRTPIKKVATKTERSSTEQPIRQEIEAVRQRCQVGMGTLHARLSNLEARQADTEDAVVMLTKLTSDDPHQRTSGFFHKMRRALRSEG